MMVMERRRDIPREVNLEIGEYSTETHELLQRCADYVRLYYLRYQEKRIPRKIISQMVELFDTCGVPIKGGRNPKTLIVNMIYPEFCNLLML
uniref:Uncharacterized protein n=1 Tax=Ditylenchus dipsaci TaxID=166011 RepID=A0A915CVQ3_9BILA